MVADDFPVKLNPVQEGLFFDCEKHTFLNPTNKRMKMKILRSKNTQLFISLFQKNNGGLLQSY